MKSTIFHNCVFQHVRVHSIIMNAGCITLVEALGFMVIVDITVGVVVCCQCKGNYGARVLAKRKGSLVSYLVLGSMVAWYAVAMRWSGIADALGWGRWMRDRSTEMGVSFGFFQTVIAVELICLFNAVVFGMMRIWNKRAISAERKLDRERPSVE